MKDVESVLGDFKNVLPEAANGEYNSTVAGLLSNVRNEFDKRIESEKTLSTQLTELQRQFSMHELEMSDLEKEQRNKVHETKRGYEKSMKKLRGEIGALDEQRLKLLRKSPTVLEKIFGRSKARIDGSSHALQSKRNDLQGREENLKRRLDGLRSDYEEKRKQLNVRETKLTEKLEKLKIGTLDDALEIRRSVCEQLRQAVAASVNRFTAQSKENPQ
jgi:predicted  nucleic acid-binding Zn-ribbon protein